MPYETNSQSKKNGKMLFIAGICQIILLTIAFYFEILNQNK